jgi:hypothetical protein
LFPLSFSAKESGERKLSHCSFADKFCARSLKFLADYRGEIFTLGSLEVCSCLLRKVRKEMRNTKYKNSEKRFTYVLHMAQIGYGMQIQKCNSQPKAGPPRAEEFQSYNPKFNSLSFEQYF